MGLEGSESQLLGAFAAELGLSDTITAGWCALSDTQEEHSLTDPLRAEHEVEAPRQETNYFPRLFARTTEKYGFVFFLQHFVA